MENIEKDIEASENTEDRFDIWVKKCIAERDLADAFKFAIKGFQYVGKLKLKYIMYALKYLAYTILGMLGIYFIYSIFSHIFDMMTGSTGIYRYSFFDSDLWYSTIVSVIVSLCTFLNAVKNGFVKELLYFIFLMAMIEYWDYSFVETYDTNTILGATCFWLFFVTIPILLIIKYNVDSPKDKNKVEETENDMTKNTSHL